MGFTIALYYFADWVSIGKMAVTTLHSHLSLGYSDVSGTEGGFTVNNLTLNGAANITFGSITIRPRILSSILSLSVVSDIEFRDCRVRLGQVMNFGDGRVMLTAGRNEILLENLSTTGEFRLNGYITLDRLNMKLGRADARIEIPDTFSDNMPMIQNFMPLVNEGGRWYLRRK